MVGYALTLVFFGLFTGRVNLNFFGEGVHEVFPLYAHAAEVGQFCLLFGAGVLALRFPVKAERLMPVGALALLACGYALTLYQAVEGALPHAASVVAGLLFGAGQGASFLGWFAVYARMGLGSAARCMAASTVLSACMLLVVGFLPGAVALFSVLSVVVACNCALLFYAPRLFPKTSIEEVAAEGPSVQGRQWLRSWVFLERRSLLCLVALAFVCGAQRVISLEGFLSQELVPFIFSLGYGLGALAFLGALAIDDGVRGGFYRTYSVLLAVMATCGVFSFVQNSAVQTGLYFVDNVAFTIVSMCMVAMTAHAAHTAPLSPVVLGGTVCGAMYFAIQAGRIACNVVEGVLGMDVVGALVISIIILYVMALAAISSAAFFRQVIGAPASDDEHARRVEAGAADAGTQAMRTVISIATVTEDRLRSNPAYRQRYGFTERELDVIVLLLAGYNAADTAEMLGLSVNTVKTHLKSVYAKAGVHNRRDLVTLLNAMERERQS